MSNIQTFQYEGKSIDFDITDNSVMVNATEMAKIFDKRVDFFMKTDSTKSFMEAIKRPPFGGQLGIEKESDLVINRKSAGLWMHRILALKFAAWLDPIFEVWVYLTIDEVLFSDYRRLEADLKESAERRLKINEIRNKLLAAPEYQELQLLELQEKQASYARSKHNKLQLTIFQDQLSVS